MGKLKPLLPKAGKLGRGSQICTVVSAHFFQPLSVKVEQDSRKSHSFPDSVEEKRKKTPMLSKLTDSFGSFRRQFIQTYISYKVIQMGKRKRPLKGRV